jgi:ATP-dependent DNA helicase RecG
MVYWFDDRIEIINAGGLFGRMTPENFGRPGFADYRNPNIAEVMKVLGFVQRFGVGVQMAQTELSENKNRLPEFIHELTTTICKVWCRPEEAPQVTGQVSEEVTRLLLVVKGEMSRKQMQDSLKLKGRDNFENLYLRPALQAGVIEMTIPEKPNSRLQKYRLTEKGKKQIS